MFPSRNVRRGMPTPAQLRNSSLPTGVRYKAEWVAILDSRVCNDCYEMDGSQRPLGSPFYPGGVQFGDQHGGGGDPAKSKQHNCRCVEVIVTTPRRK